MSHQAIRSVKLRKVRRRVFFFKILLFILFLVGLLALLVYGFNTNSFKIQQIIVEGGQPFVNQEIKESTEKILTDSYFGLISKQNILLYPKWEIKKSVLSKYPRIQEISFELDIFHDQILKIFITERQEYGVWCREQDCSFIDKDGYVFAPAPTYSEGIVFTYSGNIEGDPVGKQYLESELFKKINAFIRAIEANPKMIDLKPIALQYVDLNEYRLVLAGGGYVIFNEKNGLQNVYENLSLTIEQGDVDIGNLEYIDTRISNKVFYKHRLGDV